MSVIVMSRVAKKPITLPANVTVDLAADGVVVKGAKGTLKCNIPQQITVSQAEDKTLLVKPINDTREAKALAGSHRAIISNMVEGVSKGFEIKLELFGVGYRAQAQGNKLNLSLGFSHPVVFPVDSAITIETPTQTEIIIKGVDKRLVGEVAAQIRAYRPPEPYKGKGVRFAGERIVLKETKKK